MTGRTALAASSVVIALASAGCLSYYEVTIETPIRAKLDIAAYHTVLVAGFVTGGSRNIDANAETARLLRSRLRSNSDLKVIDADVIELASEYDKRRPAAEPGAASGAATTAAAGAADSAKPGDDTPRIKDERDLAEYDPILHDQAFWKKVASEYQDPLIITGSVLFAEVARSGMVPKLRQYTDSMGRVQYEDTREFANLKGYTLTPKFVFIDGRTGTQLYSEGFYEEALYNESQNTPALSSYFEMMDKLLPGFMNTLSTQRIRGTRVLLVK